MHPYTEPIALSPDEDGNARRLRTVHDNNHETVGSYAYETPEQTKAAENHELEKLASGDWVAVGFIVEHKCPSCNEWKEDDSLWGCIIENSGDCDKVLKEAKSVGAI